MRRNLFFSKSKQLIKYLKPSTIKQLKSYIEGINYYFNQYSKNNFFNFLTPEFYLIGYKPENFTIEDCGAILILMSYSGKLNKN
jgi:acyl-homoserine lactone acylase PvdQ